MNALTQAIQDMEARIRDLQEALTTKVHPQEGYAMMVGEVRGLRRAITRLKELNDAMEYEDE